MDALPVVGDRDLQGVVGDALERHVRHAPPAGVNLIALLEQVPHHLLQPPGVGRCTDEAAGSSSVRSATPFASAAGSTASIAAAMTPASSTRLQVQPQLARLDPAHVEQVLDQLHLGIGVARDRRQRLRLAARVDQAALQHVRPAEDRAQRGAQLVRDRRQELVLRVARALGLGARRLGAAQQLVALALARGASR